MSQGWITKPFSLPHLEFFSSLMATQLWFLTMLPKIPQTWQQVTGERISSIFYLTEKQKLSGSLTFFLLLFFFLSDYETHGGRNTTHYVQGIMGQALQLKGSEFINLHGIPETFWRGDEHSVMGLMKFHDDGVLPANKDVAVLGDGETRKNRGFHLGLRRQVSAFTG